MEDVVSQGLYLTIEGRQISTTSIFIGIQRARLPSREQIDRALFRGEALTIPVRFIGQWEILVGTVQQVVMFSQGMLVFMDPRHGGSVLKNWPKALMWIPFSPQETAGVLNY